MSMYMHRISYMTVIKTVPVRGEVEEGRGGLVRSEEE